MEATSACCSHTCPFEADVKPWIPSIRARMLIHVWASGVAFSYHNSETSEQVICQQALAFLEFFKHADSRCLLPTCSSKILRFGSGLP